MNERIRDAIIGLAAILAAVTTILMLLAFGSLRELARSSVDLEIRMNRAGGLRYGSQITLDGVPIGTVDSVNLQIEEELPVLFNCRVDEWVRIPVDHMVKVDAALIGGGTRIKILESLAAACPVVSTSVGAEGLNLPEGSAMIADGEASFSAALLSLFDDVKKASDTALLTSRALQERYSWGASASALLEAWEDCASKTP